MYGSPSLNDHKAFDWFVYICPVSEPIKSSLFPFNLRNLTEKKHMLLYQEIFKITYT